MSTEHPGLFGRLAAPFGPDEEKSRPQGGRKLPYITARTAANRLDEVLGPENWWDEYIPRENMVICRLSVRLPDGRVLAKCDAGGAAGMQDAGDDEKSAFSDAFKRACAKWGVGRYLYGDGAPRFEPEAPAGPPPAKKKGRPVPLATLAAAATPEEVSGFWAWIEGFIASEDARLAQVADGAAPGGLPPDWDSPASAFRLINHAVNWLQGRGTAESGAAGAGADYRVKAACAAWAWARHPEAFDAELARWQDKLTVEAAGRRSPAPAGDGAGAE